MPILQISLFAMFTGPAAPGLTPGTNSRIYARAVTNFTEESNEID